MAESWSAVPEWIEKAAADWTAQQLLQKQNSGKLNDVVVFHAQQCIEKLLKVRLIQLGQEVKKTHDLLALSRQLNAADPDWAWDEDQLADLSSGGVLARYPGFGTSMEEVQELVALGAQLREALHRCLGAGDGSTGL